MVEQNSPQEGPFIVIETGEATPYATTTTVEMPSSESHMTDTFELSDLGIPLVISAGFIAVYGASVWLRNHLSGKK